MQNLTLEQIRHRRQVDVWMWTNVQRPTGWKCRRADVIEKDEWPDHAMASSGQDPTDLKSIDQPRPGINDGFDHHPQSDS